MVSRISQPFRLKLEFTEGKKIPSHVAVDNLRLDSCLTGFFLQKILAAIAAAASAY